MAKLGDGCTLLASLGEIDIVLTRNKWSVRLRAIVVEKLSSEIYGGMTFLMDNDIQTRPLTGEIKVLGKYTVYQTNTLMAPPQLKNITTTNHVTLTLDHGVLFPKMLSFPSVQQEENDQRNSPESILSVCIPSDFEEENFLLVEPRIENNVAKSKHGHQFKSSRYLKILFFLKTTLSIP